MPSRWGRSAPPLTWRASTAATSRRVQLMAEDEWLGGGAIWLYQAYGKIVSGTLGVEEALDEAQGLAEEYRACVASGDDGQKTYEGCMKATDPTLPAYLFTASQ